jgi:translation elongation factor EF-Tu-like GTPase
MRNFPRMLNAMSNPQATASLTLLSTENGGRASALASGYRSLVRFADRDMDIGVEIDVPGGEVEPGESAVVGLSFWADEELLPPLPQGLRFELREGARIVGHGAITG